MPEPLPPALRREPRRRAIAALETATAPADPRALAVALDGLLDYAVTFGWEVPNRRAALKAYLDVMAEVPSDLVLTAVERVKRDWRANRLPTPANLHEFIKHELSERRMALMRLRTIDLMERPPARHREAKPDPAKAQRAAAEAKAAARSTRTPRVPGMSDADLKRAQDAWNAAARQVTAESKREGEAA